MENRGPIRPLFSADDLIEPFANRNNCYILRGRFSLLYFDVNDCRILGYDLRPHNENPKARTGNRRKKTIVRQCGRRGKDIPRNLGLHPQNMGSPPLIIAMKVVEFKAPNKMTWLTAITRRRHESRIHFDRGSKKIIGLPHEAEPKFYAIRNRPSANSART
jgi:hypothetical protein